MPSPRTESGSSPSYSLNGVDVMTPAQISRGVAFRRYAYAKPVAQIADECGLRADQVRSVLKGEPMTIEVAAVLTGWLRSSVRDKQRYQERRTDEAVMSASRRKLLRRLVRMRALIGHLKVPGGFRRTDKLAAFDDDELRAFVLNVEDMVRSRILELYPTIAKLYKFSDDMQPWEIIERVDQLKNDSQVRNTVANHQREAAEKAARAAAKAA